MSGIINVLALTGSLYMLQIYDRALTSGSIPTLLALSASGHRPLLLSRHVRRDPLAGAGAHRRAARRQAGAAGASCRDRHAPLRLFERRGPGARPRRRHGAQLPRQPGSGRAVRSAVDAAFSSSSSTCLHPMLGALTFGGAFVLTMLTIVTELRTRRLSSATHQAVIARNSVADSNARNAEILKAMGICGRAVARFDQANGEHLGAADPHQRHQRHLWRYLARAAHDPAIGRAWTRRLSDHRRRALGRRHHRRDDRSFPGARRRSISPLAIGKASSPHAPRFTACARRLSRWQTLNCRCELPPPQCESLRSRRSPSPPRAPAAS